MHFEDSVVIEQPAQKVFDYLSNPVNIPEWSGPPIEVRDLQQSVPGELREGDKFTVVAKFLGKRLETPSEVTSYEPNRRLSYRSTGGPVPQDYTFLLEEVPGGTRLTQSVEAEPGGFFGLIGPVFERVGKRQQTNDLETLKDLLETDSQ